jgi:hypothetical protein
MELIEASEREQLLRIPRARPEDVVSMHWSSACEVLTRGDLRRARHMQPDESLFG